MGRTGGWGGREPGAEAKAGADGSMGQTGGWGGREYGAEGSMGRKGVWGARLGTPRHTDLHFDPQATTFLSPPGGIYLISPGGPNLVKFRILKLKMAETESFNQRNAPRLTGGTPVTRPRMTAICRPAEVPPLRATHRIPLIARRPLFRGRLAGPKHALLRQVVPDSTWMAI